MLFVTLLMVLQGRRKEKLSKEARNTVGGSEQSDSIRASSLSSSRSITVHTKIPWKTRLEIGRDLILGVRKRIFGRNWRKEDNSSATASYEYESSI
jgi:hypothetical protein